MPRPFDRYQSFLNVPKPHELFLGGLSAHALSASLSSLFRMRLLRTAVATCFHPAGEFVGRDADARWAAARGRDVGVPTKQKFCNSVKWGTNGENVGTRIEIIARLRAF
jgi:hypothetical protein